MSYELNYFKEAATSQLEEILLLDERIEKLKFKITALTKENEELKARLSAYENGIRPEEGKDGKKYLMVVEAGLWYARWDNKLEDWFGGDDLDHPCVVTPTRLYPLHPTQEGEE